MKAEERDETTKKLRKKAFIPFGGGKHLLPGSHFAFAKILGAIGILLLGSEVKGCNGKAVEVPKGRLQRFADRVVKPDKEGLNVMVRIKRREGWEKTKWEFISGK